MIEFFSITHTGSEICCSYSIQREAQLRLAAALARGSSSGRTRLLSTPSTSFVAADPVVDEVTENLASLASHQSDGMVLHYTQELARLVLTIYLFIYLFFIFLPQPGQRLVNFTFFLSLYH
jgi:hypothetical protein